ncbi:MULTISPECIES: PepSY-associated TM helix domain-containing protein [Alkalimonas]|uniref:PepSY-associated TM helix domain-containing protein n=1 Tax=Alkalimonas mucilaginosa TaxID=3057676 RepID=A0ABU7JDE5_9GAMM|nr:PepSY-associated TM helix domain-containing protein [Alkalimonas sp. MEB004]MEE2023063.1 PepSY-associated TM helix domain-containing protein [Alkalimonas sp. MEB004]
MKPSPFNLQRLMRALHTYSAMWVLLLLLFFSITGITLNHPNWQSQWGSYQRLELLPVPAELQRDAMPEAPDQQHWYAQEVQQWLQQQHGVRATEWRYQFDNDDELLELEFKRPAGYVTALLDFDAAELELEQVFAGYLALANDLHKGRDAGGLWAWLIDITAISCLVFALTGFYLLLKSQSMRAIGNTLALLGGMAAILIYLMSLHI